jgi:hypothetical protein
MGAFYVLGLSANFFTASDAWFIERGVDIFAPGVSFDSANKQM